MSDKGNYFRNNNGIKPVIGGRIANSFVVDDGRADEDISLKRMLASNLNDKKSGVRSSFASLYSIDQFTAGLDGMQRGMGEIAGEFEHLANIDQSFVNESKYGDDSLASKADELFISHDFVGNNSMEINTYNKSILGKVDGTSVNNGEKSLTNAHVDESTTISRESLIDVTKGATVEQHAKDIQGITKEDSFVDVTKGATEEQHAKDIEGIAKEDSFAQINKESDVSVNKIDDGSNVQEQVLVNISKDGGAQEQHLEDRFDGIQEKQLGNISNGNLGARAELQMDANEISKVSNFEVKK